MNTKSKQDQKKNRRPQAGQAQEARAQGAKRGQNSRTLHEQELPESRMTR
jgi:hypothetical protein